MGLTDAATLGIGALMGAGIYVLIGLAADRAGPAVWLSYTICGLLSFLSVFIFGELSRIAPTSGGGYAFAYNTLGSFWGFFTGWLLALGSIFACTMYAIGFAYYFASVLSPNIPAFLLKIFALTVVLLLTLLNCRGTKSGGGLQRFLTWGNLLVLFLLIAFCIPKASTHAIKPMFSQGFKGIGQAISIIYVSFFGYQLIANNADEIIDPKRTIPKAMFISMTVSLLFYVAVAIVSVMVVPWQNLAVSKIPLVDVAQKGIGRSGWLLISIGGILASGAALNSTLQSQARQIFAMGKDRFFPAIIGRIHEVYRTPIAALLVGGLATVVAVLFGDLIFIVKSANFCFLISLLPASFALRKLYQSPENKVPVNRIRRLVPYAAFFSNLALLFTLDVVSVLFGVQLTLIGAAIYFFYSRKREIRSQTGLSLVLTENKKSMMIHGTRILIPVANPQTQPALFAMAESLLAGHAGEIVMLNVVQAKHQVDFSSALAGAENSLDLLDHTVKLPKLDRIRIRPVTTLIFSLEQYRAVVQAYMDGLEKWIDTGGNPNAVSSVASFFVSRVDTVVDERLREFSGPASRSACNELLGQAAIANANLVYELYCETLLSERWKNLLKMGAKPQRVLGQH